MMDDIEENISTLRSQGNSFISVLKYTLYEQEIFERITPYVYAYAAITIKHVHIFMVILCICILHWLSSNKVLLHEDKN